MAFVPFRVVSADPPWKFGDKLGARGAEDKYPCLETWQIQRFPLPPMADDAILFLWRVSSMPEEALTVMRAWGFVPKAELTWGKTSATPVPALPVIDLGLDPKISARLEELFPHAIKKLTFGMGRYVRNCHETAIIGVRGKVDFDALMKDQRSIFFAPVGEHSEKPDEFYRIVERMTKGEGPYLEVFGRKPRPGWTVIGNELPGGVVTTSTDGCVESGGMLERGHVTPEAAEAMGLAVAAVAAGGGEPDPFDLDDDENDPTPAKAPASSLTIDMEEPENLSALCDALAALGYVISLDLVAAQPAEHRRLFRAWTRSPHVTVPEELLDLHRAAQALARMGAPSRPAAALHALTAAAPPSPPPPASAPEARDFNKERDGFLARGMRDGFLTANEVKADAPKAHLALQYKAPKGWFKLGPEWPGAWPPAADDAAAQALLAGKVEAPAKSGAGRPGRSDLPQILQALQAKPGGMLAELVALAYPSEDPKEALTKLRTGLSALKAQGKATNPERGVWRATEGASAVAASAGPGDTVLLEGQVPPLQNGLHTLSKPTDTDGPFDWDGFYVGHVRDAHDPEDAMLDAGVAYDGKGKTFDAKLSTFFSGALVRAAERERTLEGATT